MRKMQEIQPQVKAIQDRYAKLKTTDPARQKMNTEMMELYKSKGVNPASGCVPMLLTMPVLFAFYALLSRGHRAARRAVRRLDPGSVAARSALHHADHDGRDDVLAAADDAGDRRSGAAADDDVHAADVHGLLPVGAERPGASTGWSATCWTIGQQYLTNRMIGAAGAGRGAADAPTKRGEAAGATTDERRDQEHCTARCSAFVEQRRRRHGPDVDGEVDGPRGRTASASTSRARTAKLLLRRKGEALDALQHSSTPRSAATLGGDERIVVDCQDFRHDKDAELQQMAQVPDREGQDDAARRRRWARSTRTRAASCTSKSRRSDVASESSATRREDGHHHRRKVALSARRSARSTQAAMFSTDDTIVAIATPPGRGGSASSASAAPRRMPIARCAARARRPLAPRRATLTRGARPGVRRRRRAAIDQRRRRRSFAAPHSYTGEDVVEISAHGSPVVLERDRRAARCARARGWRAPGEFTLRAYLNGKLDLVQAEAVADLIEAVTPAQARRRSISSKAR